MDEPERARAKVEAGEVLTEGEFRVLERAAAAEGGPALRLCVAQALSNAEQDREALALLERLVRDFPNDLQTRLGHARALLGLERYADAEGALQAALQLNPDDPEVFKALAVCALRRGERARAAQLVQQVLLRDPFDGEARLIHEELEAADLPPSGDVGAAVRAELIRRRVRSLVTAREVLVLVKGELRRAPLPGPSPAFDGKAAARFVAELLELPPLDAGAQPLLQAVLPVLRAADFMQTAKGAIYREGPAGVLVFYVLEHPELVRYVPAAAASAAGVSLETLDQSAFRRLEAAPAALKQISPGLWLMASEDGHDGARLLTASQRERLRAVLGPGPWRVDLGRREAVFACSEANPEAVNVLERLPPAADGVVGRFRLAADGVLEQVR